MPSKRERAKQEKNRTNGVPGSDKSCQARHPVWGTKCWSGKPCKAGGRHFVVRPKTGGGGIEKFYWTAHEEE